MTSWTGVRSYVVQLLHYSVVLDPLFTQCVESSSQLVGVTHCTQLKVARNIILHVILSVSHSKKAGCACAGTVLLNFELCS